MSSIAYVSFDSWHIILMHNRIVFDGSHPYRNVQSHSADAACKISLQVSCMLFVCLRVCSLQYQDHTTGNVCAICKWQSTRAAACTPLIECSDTYTEVPSALPDDLQGDASCTPRSRLLHTRAECNADAVGISLERILCIRNTARADVLMFHPLASSPPEVCTERRGTPVFRAVCINSSCQQQCVRR